MFHCPQYNCIIPQIDRLIFPVRPSTDTSPCPAVSSKTLGSFGDNSLFGEGASKDTIACAKLTVGIFNNLKSDH